MLGVFFDKIFLGIVKRFKVVAWRLLIDISKGIPNYEFDRSDDKKYFFLTLEVSSRIKTRINVYFLKVYTHSFI